ncbi:hypothetical protein BOP93_04070 [Pseudomonas orientalis]|uniref:Uncharacterized protein n=2 Tax=Pseudomonas orientalis TaxID=76758 RepID=A0A2L0RRZ7_9PSED|nr:hypothetical protein BOP93_04070 [Pseudomonas orientalis]
MGPFVDTVNSDSIAVSQRPLVCIRPPGLSQQQQAMQSPRRSQLILKLMRLIMATKKCTFKSRSNKSKAATHDFDVALLPNIGDTIELEGDPAQEVIAKNFVIIGGDVVQIDFTFA